LRLGTESHAFTFKACTRSWREGIENAARKAILASVNAAITLSFCIDFSHNSILQRNDEINRVKLQIIRQHDFANVVGRQQQRNKRIYDSRYCVTAYLQLRSARVQ
jgi:hypothetical protein